MRRNLAATVAAAAALALLLPAQQTTQPTQAPFKFSTHSWLVVEAVTVTDKAGHPVQGLTAKDFTVTEDGKPQTIAFCEYQRVDDVAAAPAAAESAPPPPPASSPNLPAAAATSVPIAPVQRPGRRLVALYFDMSAMPQSDALRALTSARKFIASSLRPADLVALMVYDGTAVKVKLDFTDNRPQLEQALNTLTLGAMGYDENANDLAASDYGSAFGQDDSEFNIFNTNRQLAALQTAVNLLAPLNAKKSLVYFASGLNLRGVDNQAQLEATTNAAIRANVAFFPVDARGLVASAPLGDATQGSPGGVSMYNGGAAAALSLRLQSSQDTLYALGSDTGGKALLDNNDLGRGIETARDAIGDYYLVGYYTSNPALDGKYRKVQVALAPPATAKLAYRTGYYAGKAFAKFTAADKERQLEDALMLGDPITDLTIALEVNWFQLNSAEYFVPIAAKIPGSELALAKKGGASQATIDFIGEVKDDYGTTITNLRDQVKLKLSGETAAQLAQSPIEYTAGFTLLPGKYSIKLLARDDQTGRIGTYLSTFTIPNLMRATDRLPISSVVLSSQRVPVAAALFNANKSLAQDPLVNSDGELLPSVTRVFHRKSPIYVYLQAYRHLPAAPAAAPAATKTAAPAPAPDTALFGATIAFYRDGKLAYQSPIVAPARAPQGRSGAVPLQLTIPPSTLAPGRYTAQVTALDPTQQHAAVWRTEVQILP